MPSESSTDSRARWLFVASLAILFVALITVLIRTAWLCDDAYITYRTIDNLQAGHGLVWNVGERVQPHTHPLWMLLVATVTWITGDLYETVFGIGIVLTLATALITTRILGAGWGSVTTLIILCLSRSFIDFSTGGLEDPLSHILLAAFLWITFQPADEERRIPRATAQALIIGLALTTRMDTLLLYAPTLLLLVRSNLSRRGLRIFAIGFSPFIAWEIFSLIYFGFPFPNVAYAKLGIAIPFTEVSQQGLAYLQNSFRNDPITTITMAAGIGLTFIRRTPRSLPIAIGTLLYLAYIVRVGGDFMGGRMLSLPLLASAILLGRAVATLNWKPALAFPLAAVVLGFLAPFPTPTTGSDFAPAERLLDAADTNGIADERMVYYRATGLLSSFRLKFEKPHDERDMPAHSWAVRGYEASKKPASVMPRSTVGYFGFFAGPKVHVVDTNALTDAFLARIPRLARHKTRNERDWRIGHFTRKLPAGYLQTLKTGENKLEHPDLARYYDELKLVITGPLFSTDRWRAIWALNTGKRDGWMGSYLRSLD